MFKFQGFIFERSLLKGLADMVGTGGFEPPTSIVSRYLNSWFLLEVNHDYSLF